MRRGIAFIIVCGLSFSLLVSCSYEGKEQTESIDMTVSEEEELVIEETPIEETEPVEIEESEDIVISEDISEEPEESVIEEIEVEVEETIEPPSEEIIHAMVDNWIFWCTNCMSSEDVLGVSITPTTNQAVELSANAYYFSFEDPYSHFDYVDVGEYILPEEGIAESLRNRFGSQYDIANFTNTPNPNPSGDYSSDIFCSAFGYENQWLGTKLYKQDGQFIYTLMPSDFFNYTSDVVIQNIEEYNSEDNSYYITVGYGFYYYDYENSTEDNLVTVDFLRPVGYVMVPDDSSDYGWVITQITYFDVIARD